MKAAGLRELSVEQLEAKEEELRGELFTAKVRHSTGQVENVAKLGLLRHDIARVKTVLCEKREASK